MSLPIRIRESQMSQVSPKAVIVPEEDATEEPTCWTRNCGPETQAFKIRVRIQEVGIINMHFKLMDARDADIRYYCPGCSNDSKICMNSAL